MYTYQDYLVEKEKTQESLIEWVRQAINYHVSSKEYKEAETAEEYFKRRNVTILEFQKLLYTVSGKAIPDNYSANFKLRSNFFNYFITQMNQYLLSNGVTWENESTGDKLGEDFDRMVLTAGRYALTHRVSFGFFNLDHVEVFSYLEFVPLYDEENGALRAGIRFWQIDPTKPLRATLYEEDGYTEYIWRQGASGEVLIEKRPYKIIMRSTEAEEIIYDGENYPSFPIVPFFGLNKQSELEGRRESIDCYDLIRSGFANNVDEASYIYWAIQGAGGMKDMDLAKFVERMKTLHAALVNEEGARAEPNSIEAPYQSRVALLEELKTELYENFMALNVSDIASGAVTATQIKASYEPLNMKTSDYEYCVIDFIKGILQIAGIEDNPTFTRSIIINTTEDIQNVLASADYLSEDYVTRKLLTILGDADQADAIIEEKDAEAAQRFNEESENVDDGQSTSDDGSDNSRDGEASEERVRTGGERGTREAQRLP